MNVKVVIRCKDCPVCEKPSWITVDPNTASRVMDWLHAPDNKPFIQHALPMLSVDEREQILTGIHGPCYDKLFADD
jgi:hypothetical protein